MPRIFDNMNEKLLPALADILKISYRADFCIGYFNLRGWKLLSSYIENWNGGEGNCCRLLIGMQKLPHDELKDMLSLKDGLEGLDKATAIKIKNKLAQEFKKQLVYGAPSKDDEVGLRNLSRQLKEKKVIVKLFVKHQLHAKLYMLFRKDPVNPIIGFMGSSNLTMPGLLNQGELNIDVLDGDASKKLSNWFNDRWNDRWCIDISEELSRTIDESWAREEQISPYHIYIKMAYHMSHDAREGLSEFRIPKDFGNTLFDFQVAAVKIAAHHISKRGGVLIGDVVGLGKSFIASAAIRILEDDYDLETLIICPKNLVPMWEDYKERYRLRAKILSISKVKNELPNLRRYRLVVIDESHNLRNREGKRYKAIQEYIQENESKVMLLTATPYNKAYLDISSQLRLFIKEEENLGIRPEQLIKNIGETEFYRQYQCSLQSIAAFEKSQFYDDWRQLMRRYLIRRTRSFIQENYALEDEDTGRKYLLFGDGTRSYFPDRIPKTIKFKIDDNNKQDQYALLYSDKIVDIINNLKLPRYGLGNYISKKIAPIKDEESIIRSLSKAGKHLMGFCRTNLFKRLESSGHAFILSLQRHVLRNYILIYAIENNKPIPIGSQDASLLDFSEEDSDLEDLLSVVISEDDEDQSNLNTQRKSIESILFNNETYYKEKAEAIYETYISEYESRFKWLRPTLFMKNLKTDLMKDSNNIINILDECGAWDPDRDIKLRELFNLISKEHQEQKVLIFTQFSDTAYYLEKELAVIGINNVTCVTGDTDNPTEIVWRFSPDSNNKKNIKDGLRVLIATDVLSEGQNLQDCSIIINYDLPWAIIRLIQRAGRIDRIGQKSEKILCYSFLPADGVERIISLRSRIEKRLQENAEVVGADEAFFESKDDNNEILNLYNEKAGILDGEDDGEVDLASYAYQIWKKAIDENKNLGRVIPELPSAIYSTKEYKDETGMTEGVISYARTSEENDSLIWINKDGVVVTQSPLAILNAAACASNCKAIKRYDNHHELVKRGLKIIIDEEKTTGGQLGRPSGARFRTYERLKRFIHENENTLFVTEDLKKAFDEIYKYPLKQIAKDIINRQLKSGIHDDKLAELVINLRNEDRLCITDEAQQENEPVILCSLGLFDGDGGM
jgi:superfamily II DNA or RNA helicase